MRPIPVEKLPANFVRDNREKIFPDCKPVECAGRVAKIVEQAEKALQDMCERWLRLNGYNPRTPEFIRAGKPERGYYIHLHETQRNPIILDILILGVDGRFIEIELKTETGAVRESQGYILHQMGDHAVLVRSFEEFRLAVTLWERAGVIQRKEKNECSQT